MTDKRVSFATIDYDESETSYEKQIEELKECIRILENHISLRDMTAEKAFEIMSNWR